jgi:glycosyltransferase involved in cell wall biosynthesis
MVKVSVIVPCLNEEKTINLLLNALNLQTYPAHDFEIIIADGMSTDGTREKIQEYGSAHPELFIKLIENQKKTIPSGLNLALQDANGEIIIRLDAHSIPAKDYIEKCVSILDKTKAANVGGRWDIQPVAQTWMAKSVAAAASNPVGVGDAFYRYSETAGEVDTVPFGAYYKSTAQELNGYDESLLTNEDYELNTRIREQGGKIWFDPSIRSIYFARPTLKALAQQYYRYGYWKAQMIKRYPATIKWRQALPPLFILSIIFFAVISFLLKFGWIFLVAELTIYVVILGLFGIRDSFRSKNLGLVLGEPLAIATMHQCWGLGFLIGLFKVQRKQ